MNISNRCLGWLPEMDFAGGITCKIALEYALWCDAKISSPWHLTSLLSAALLERGISAKIVPAKGRHQPTHLVSKDGVVICIWDDGSLPLARLVARNFLANYKFVAVVALGMQQWMDSGVICFGDGVVSKPMFTSCFANPKLSSNDEDAGVPLITTMGTLR